MKLIHREIDEETMWKQRAEEHWLREGYRNTRYFHEKASTRAEVNKIEFLLDEVGNRCTSKLDIQGVIERYFRGLFQSELGTDDEIAGALQSVRTRISVEAQDDLLLPFSMTERQEEIGNLKGIAIWWGIVARNHEGAVVKWKADVAAGPPDPELAELLAAYTTVKLAKNMGWRVVLFEGDCLGVVRKLKSLCVDHSYLGNIVEDVRSLVVNFDSCDFIFVRYEANCVAHVFARNAASALFVMGNFSSCISSLCVNSDFN